MLFVSTSKLPACTHCSTGIIYGCQSLQSRIFPVKLDNSPSLSTVLTVCASLLTPPQPPSLPPPPPLHPPKPPPPPTPPSKQTHATEKIINSKERREEEKKPGLASLRHRQLPPLPPSPPPLLKVKTYHLDLVKAIQMCIKHENTSVFFRAHQNARLVDHELCLIWGTAVSTCCCCSFLSFLLFFQMQTRRY